MTTSEQRGTAKDQERRTGTDGRPAAAPRYEAVSPAVWDISDDEISEWRKTPGMLLAGLAAERVRDGMYGNGEQIYPPGSAVHQEAPREDLRRQMAVLVERGMARQEGDRWYAIAPGRMEPSLQRATKVFLDRRAELPPDLTAALDSWKATLDRLNTPAAETGNSTAPPAPEGTAAA